MIRSCRKKGGRGKLSRTAGRLSKVHKNNLFAKKRQTGHRAVSWPFWRSTNKIDWRKFFFVGVEEWFVATHHQWIHFLQKGSHGQVLGVLIDAKSCDAVGCAQSDREKEVWQYWLRVWNGISRKWPKVDNQFKHRRRVSFHHYVQERWQQCYHKPWLARQVVTKWRMGINGPVYQNLAVDWAPTGTQVGPINGGEVIAPLPIKLLSLASPSRHLD